MATKGKPIQQKPVLILTKRCSRKDVIMKDIVYCKDCKYARQAMRAFLLNTEGKPLHCTNYYVGHGIIDYSQIIMYRDFNDYCSYGRKKDETHN